MERFLSRVTQVTVPADGQAAKPPAWLRTAGGSPNLAIVETLSFFPVEKKQGFDRLSPSGLGMEMQFL